MSKNIEFMTAEELLAIMNEEINHLVITGEAGIGKSELALKFSETYSDDVIYCSLHCESGRSNVKDAGEALRKQLRVNLNEVLKRKTSEENDFNNRFIIIDGVQDFEDILIKDKKLSEIVKYGKDVGVYVILISQLKDSLSIIDDEILEMFIKVNLPLEIPSKGTYRHYKGGIYEVIGIGKHSETQEELVFYVNKEGDLWARPVDMFNETVEVNGEIVERFKKI